MRDELCIHSVTKCYKKNTIPANNNINVTFHPGQITAVTGHNGAGKTTLLNQIIGHAKPDHGAITYQGYSLTKKRAIARKLVAMMPQFHAPLNGVTMRQAIDSILRIRGLSKQESKTQTTAILKELQISMWADSPGEKLSGGLQRLTSFAMAVAAAPPIILLDEPTNDVDPVRRKIIWKYLKMLASKGHIVIIVTHNLLEVEHYADRYLLLDKGKIIKDAFIRASGNFEKLSTQLTIFTSTELEIDHLPLPNTHKFFKDELKYELQLEQNQIVTAMEWVTENMQNNLIINYKLAPASLDEIYGGLTNED